MMNGFLLDFLENELKNFSTQVKLLSAVFAGYSMNMKALTLQVFAQSLKKQYICVGHHLKNEKLSKIKILGSWGQRSLQMKVHLKTECAHPRY